MTAGEIEVVMVKTKHRKDAMHLWCPECDKIIAFGPGQYWDISKTKWMHERGTKHHPFYVYMEKNSNMEGAA